MRDEPLKGTQKVLNGFEMKISPIIKQTKGKEIKISTSKQMLQISPIALQVMHQKT